MKKTLLIGMLAFSIAPVVAQEAAVDTVGKMKYLKELTVVGRGSRSDITNVPEIVGTSIYAGRKNSLIIMDNVQGNIVTQNMRQVMAKVPGIHIWESDGSGIQIGIAARGLSPNRSWEFNVRQNGYDISADPYGYPEAYYNPPLQAVQRIEVVRGQGALQYGPQFGGMVNYILRDGSEFTKPIEFETHQTAGSNGLFNSFTGVGGETKNFHYYASFDHRQADGWRQNSRYRTNNGFGTFTYKITDRFKITAEMTQYGMVSQQPGGLTDAQIQQDIQQSVRSRNWFSNNWRTAALTANYEFKTGQRLMVKAFAMLGDRNSVGFFPSAGIGVKDTINKQTGEYNPRVVDLDDYRNYGFETRYLGDYTIAGKTQTLSAGIRLYQGTTRRLRGGVGTTGMDYDVTTKPNSWNGVFEFDAFNAAAFVENIFRINNRLSIIPGVRVEYLEGSASGFNGFSNGNPIVLNNPSRSRAFVLGGIGAEYHVGPKQNTEFYANISQAYRPVQFADLAVPPTTDVIDPNLTDAQGYNADLGYRGKVSDYLYFDASVYFLQYNNRVGTIRQQRPDGTFYNYRTNVGNSTAKGVEAIVEFSPIKAFLPNATWGNISVFTSYSFNDAQYGDFKVITQNGSSLQEKSLKGNRVENAPKHIVRAGLTYSYRGFSITGQYSYVDEVFTDANNTVAPTANAVNGLIPAYRVADLTLGYKINQNLTVKAGINNLTDERYFTRRAGGYPGPGAMPADGRTAFATLVAKF